MNSKQPWNRLDNAAKVFPAASSVLDPRVFRCACELYDEVTPQLLQEALDETMGEFPYFRSTIKKGLFWYYLEESNLSAEVAEEQRLPCSPIYSRDRHTLLIAVNYHRNRINLEIFHALTDGTGGLRFFQRLLMAYLHRRYLSVHGQLHATHYQRDQIIQDGYSKYYSKVRPGRRKKRSAFQLKGERNEQFRFGMITCHLSARALLSLAKEKEATMTELLAVYLMEAIHGRMSVMEEQYPVVLSIPVDLRRYFPTDSMRNFFGVILVGHDFSAQGQSFGDILANVKAQFSQQLSEQAVRERMSLMTSIEKNWVAKAIPLVLKSPGLRMGNSLFDRSFTAGLSNVGELTMPPGYAPYVRLFDVFSSTKKLDVCLCSYQDTVSISFTSSFAAMDIQQRMIGALSRLGLDVTVDSNV